MYRFVEGVRAKCDGFQRAYGFVPCVPPLQRWIHTTFESLPVVDVAPLIDATATHSARASVGKELHHACKDVGFFYVKNHGISEDVLSGLLNEARKWFSLPEQQKKQIALSRETCFRGWQPLGANVTRYDGGFVRDLHEGIDLYREVSPQDASRLPPSPIHGTNPWPSQIPAFEHALRQYIDACLTLGASLMRGIALGLGLHEATFDAVDTAGVPYWVLRVIRYPPLPTPQGSGAAAALGGAEVARNETMSCGEHSDYGLLTLVNQDPNATALQVMSATGRWVDAPPLPGTLVVNIGDILRVWTNGLYEPTLHRVVHSPTKTYDRISVPFFYEPSYEAVVAPMREFGRPKIPSVRYGSHLESKVLRNFEL